MKTIFRYRFVFQLGFFAMFVGLLAFTGWLTVIASPVFFSASRLINQGDVFSYLID